jgi:3-deoxy-7-phosphoheptulonate synthase
VIIGPCSIHDPKAAIEYAKHLCKLQNELRSELLIVMRVYFEKPRTTLGWKGLINDPDLNGSFDINKGLYIARKLLIELGEMGMPAGTEFLDLISPQYIADLISWGAIGARTSESQVHRELVSGLSCPVGFKNSTDGSVKIATDAILSSSQPHVFLSITKEANTAIFHTRGNKNTHMILRGGERPNYDSDSVNLISEKMVTAGIAPRLLIDCSHANSQRIPENQINVLRNVSQQIERGEKRIIGVMIESNLVPGRQELVTGEDLVFGQSITDACIGWNETVSILHDLARANNCRGSVSYGDTVNNDIEYLLPYNSQQNEVFQRDST